MASEYIKYITRDEKPAEAPPPLSPKERRKNWLYYHKWHLIIGGVLLVIALALLRSVLHVGETMPDVQITYAGRYALPDAVLPELESRLSAICPDANGDGKSVVLINSCPLPDDNGESDPLTSLSMASVVQLMADMENCISFLFVTDDPARFESAYHVFAFPDGTLPETEEDTVLHPEKYTVSWTECPVLNSLTEDLPEILGEEADAEEVKNYLNSLYIARRGFWTKKTCPFPEECQSFWEALRSGGA